MDGMKIWCLQASLEYHSEMDEPIGMAKVIEAAEEMYEYLHKGGQQTATVVDFKPKGVN